MRSRKRRRNRYFPVVETTPLALTLTPEEILADLDPGWAGWEPLDRPSEDTHRS